MKKLLHLYNYGHNPFPHLGKGGLGYHLPHTGRGGLGYHLPQYRKRSLHGDGFDLDTLQFVPDDDMTKDEAEKRNKIINEDVNARSFIEPLQVKPSEPQEPQEPQEDEEPIEIYDPSKESYESYIKNKIVKRPKWYQLNEISKILESRNMTDDTGQIGLKTIAKELGISTKLKRDDMIKEILNATDKRPTLKKLLQETKDIHYNRELEKQKERDQNVKEYEDKEELLKVEINKKIDGQIQWFLKKNKHISLSPEAIDKIRNTIRKRLLYNTDDEYKNVSGLDIKKEVEELGLGTVNQDILNVVEFDKMITKKFKSSEGKYDNTGEVFEDVMRTTYKSELEELTNKKNSPFRSPQENEIYFNSDNTPKMMKTVRVVNGMEQEIEVPIFKNTLFDSGNKDTEIEFKYLPTYDHCEIQIGKFTGNGFQTPYYHEVNGEWKLHNVWVYSKFDGVVNIKSWVNKYNDKNVYVFAQLDDGRYKFSITDFIKNSNDIELDQVSINGKTLWKINKNSIRKIFEPSERDGGNKWIKIKKDDMIKI
jgi:hypothetical protein